ncbi:hypothetical protein [Desulfovibrio litoralis]|uniref:Uncharacterized protein n=1 Tax=Desulfovibrio litoralis DSM 11393 TaxID=1121455 RepID=A0A1M7TE45_9BACT|nr:hypothetical protein [Desulfovibrio litoralis]SHN69034.1 hypothetical protein SAMN02745728_01897 [Desulfovibrio litoralis DSM 11393]
MRKIFSRRKHGVIARVVNFVLVPVLILLLSALFLAGCSTFVEASDTPRGFDRPIGTLADSGSNIANVGRWHVVAADIASSVRRALEYRPELMAKPLCLPTPQNRAFPKAFFNLLKTELVSRGLQVSEQPEFDSVSLTFSVYRLNIPSRQGIEVMITARMVYNNRYVMQKSGTYFAGNEDAFLFQNTDNGFVGGNGGTGTAESLWEHYAIRNNAFKPKEPETMPINRGVLMSSARTSEEIDRIVDAQIRAGGGVRIDPNAPPTKLSSTRHRR